MTVATEAVRPAPSADAGEPGPPSRTAVLLVVIAGVLAAALILWESRGRTFFYDEWSFVQDRSYGGIKTLLEPHNEHVSIFPAAIYRVLFEVFGLSHNWPFRIPVLLVHLACAGFVFTLVRRRAGDAWAVIATVLILFLGQAFEDLVWGFQIGFMLSILGGLVAWWALDRDDRAGDVIACAALVVASLSSSLGVPLALGVLAETAYRRRWGALWVGLVPLVLYGIWYVGYGKSAIVREGVWHAPAWAMDAAGAAAGSLFGRGLDWGRPLLLAAGALAIYAIVRRGLTARLVGLLVAGGAFWLLTGAARSAGLTPTQPESSRYQYLGALVIILIAAELGRRRLLPRAAWGVAAVVAAIAVAQSLTVLHDGAKGMREASDKSKAQIAAAELTRPRLPADYRFAPEAAPQVTAAQFFAAVDANDSRPVNDPVAELADASAGERTAADDVFVAVDAALEPGRTCRSGAEQAPAGEREAPPGGLTVTAGSAPVGVGVRRYADTAHGIGTIPAGESRRVRIAPDASKQPWRVTLGAPAAVC